jgi:3'(2'), 5'-bisphosphate nucleotidase
MSFLTQEQIEKITQLAFEAGEIAKSYFKSSTLKTNRKPDNSLVSEADLVISKFLSDNLLKEFPQIPIVCEEGNLRVIDKETFWLIDPIDGTSSFIEGSDQFAICIALIQNKKAVFGLIYAPVFEGGKMAVMNGKNQVILIDRGGNKTIPRGKRNEDSDFRIIASVRAKQSDIDLFIAQFYFNLNKKITIERLSSAVKFFRLIEGKADVYLHLRESMEWDIAAGSALLENMNGKVKNLLFNEGKYLIDGDLIYKKPNFINQFFVATF